MKTPTELAHQVLAEIDAAISLSEKATPGPWRLACGAVKAGDATVAYPPKITDVLPLGGYNDGLFIAASRTDWPKSLRCLKTAITGLMEIAATHTTERWFITSAQTFLTTLCDQWEETK